MYRVGAVAIPRGRIAYTRVEGPEPYLILLHGMPLDRDVWREQQFILKDSFGSIAIDLPGFGDSYRAPDGTSFLTQSARAVEEIVATLSLRRPVLLGHSAGGYAALEVIGRGNIELGGVVLCSSRCRPDPDWKRKERLTAAEELEAGRLEHFITAQVASCRSRRPEFAEDVEAMVRKNITASLSGILRQLAAREDTSRVIRRTAVPSLFLAGKDDTVFVEEADYTSRLCSHGTLTLIRDAGHMVFFDQPSLFAEALTAWWRRSCGWKRSDNASGRSERSGPL